MNVDPVYSVHISLSAHVQLSIRTSVSWFLSVAYVPLGLGSCEYGVGSGGVLGTISIRSSSTTTTTGTLEGEADPSERPKGRAMEMIRDALSRRSVWILSLFYFFLPRWSLPLEAGSWNILSRYAVDRFPKWACVCRVWWGVFVEKYCVAGAGAKLSREENCFGVH